MKNLMTFLILTCFFLSMDAQIIKLEETKVKAANYVPVYFQQDSEGFIIPERFDSQFEIDALGFVFNNFNMKDYINGNLIEESDSYEVTFRNRKGFLRANYDDEGAMVRSSQRFTQMALPYEIRNEIFSQYQGWDITRSTYIARGTGDKIDKGFYKIRVENGSQKKNIKLYTTTSSSQTSKIAVATN
ncbi:hypothetical protein RM549_09905 [Salegentibacter sp. F188]|uniref:Uncharacterized protein n=1 Tax=Autumnicola patrickiae TaxID=3075591 RepID=A0ABU3E275_9FLAO|nr:hypothetical protein [Salegentibacter sp. F188]MDT0690098.1 hypothetical protein [Salegentibacter sp. F188]